MSKTLLALLATNVFWLAYNVSNSIVHKDIMKRESKAAVQRGFGVGCMAAFRATGRVPDGDPLEPVYTDWCEKNSKWIK